MKDIDVCKLCGKGDASVKEILQHTTLMLEDVVPELDVKSAQSWKLCNVCLDSLEDVYNFKCRCIKNCNIITCSVSNQEMPISLEVLLPEISVLGPEEKICRLCLKATEEFNSFDEIKKEAAFTEIYEQLLRELKMHLTKDPVACTDCKNTLQLQTHLIFACSKTEGTQHGYKDSAEDNGAAREKSHSEILIIKKEPKEEETVTVQPCVEETSDEPEPICKKDIKLEDGTDEAFEEQLPEAYKNNPDQTFVCEYCPFVTKNKYTIKRHAIVHKDPDEITMFRCELCDFQTRYKRSIENHLILHRSPEEVTMHKCAQCHYETKIKRNLVKHMVAHKAPSQTTMFLCKVCPYKSKYKNALDYHMLSHQTPEESIYYSCEFCPFSTKLKSSLKRHALTHKSIDEVPTYSCDECSYKAKRKGHLKDHMLTHRPNHTVTMYQCDQCPYQSKHKNSLKAHITNHKNPKDVITYKCDCCSYETKYKSHLSRHKAIHADDGEKMYKCQECPYQTRIVNTLQRHMIFHKNEDEIVHYKCDMCTYQTKLKNNLKRHKVVHKI